MNFFLSRFCVREIFFSSGDLLFNLFKIFCLFFKKVRRDNNYDFQRINTFLRVFACSSLKLAKGFTTVSLNSVDKV